MFGCYICRPRELETVTRLLAVQVWEHQLHSQCPCEKTRTVIPEPGSQKQCDSGDLSVMNEPQVPSEIFCLKNKVGRPCRTTPKTELWSPQAHTSAHTWSCIKPTQTQSWKWALFVEQSMKDKSHFSLMCFLQFLITTLTGFSGTLKPENQDIDLFLQVTESVHSVCPGLGRYPLQTKQPRCLSASAICRDL